MWGCCCSQDVVSLSLSLSLSHTHTDTHANCLTLKYCCPAPLVAMRGCCCFRDLSLSLSHTHTHTHSLICRFHFSRFVCHSDINECSEGSHDCHGNAACTDVSGSFVCSCNNGYTGNGKQCQGTIEHLESLSRALLSLSRSASALSPLSLLSFFLLPSQSLSLSLSLLSFSFHLKLLSCSMKGLFKLCFFFLPQLLQTLMSVWVAEPMIAMAMPPAPTRRDLLTAPVTEDLMEMAVSAAVRSSCTLPLIMNV